MNCKHLNLKHFYSYDANKSDLGETVIITEGETILFHPEVYIFC